MKSGYTMQPLMPIPVEGIGSVKEIPIVLSKVWHMGITYVMAALYLIQHRDDLIRRELTC